jgi:DNA-binding MarR family transcriptional regulator
MAIEENDQKIINLLHDTFKGINSANKNSGCPALYPQADMSMSQMRVLWLIRKHGPVTMTNLAEIMHIKSGSLTEQIDTLVKSGLVDRKHSETDRRIVYVELCPKTREIFAKSYDSKMKNFSHILSSLSASDKKQLIQLLQKINDAIVEPAKV